MTERQISAEDIEAAERLMGVSYSAEERAQMVGNIEGQIALAVARRGVPLGNDAPGALRFDPRLPGFVLPRDRGPRFSEVPQVAVPEDPEDIAFAPLPQLSTGSGAGS